MNSYIIGIHIYGFNEVHLVKVQANTELAAVKAALVDPHVEVFNKSCFRSYDLDRCNNLKKLTYNANTCGVSFSKPMELAKEIL